MVLVCICSVGRFSAVGVFVNQELKTEEAALVQKQDELSIRPSCILTTFRPLQAVVHVQGSLELLHHALVEGDLLT